MQNTKGKPTQNPYLVTKVSLVDSIRNIPSGVSATFDCREAGPMTSANSCVCRLNKSAGREEYTIATIDNGVTYTITHKDI